MNELNFWQKLKKPFIGQSPMDGVSDAAFRYITDKYGHPDLLYTEFVPAEAINRGVVKLLRSFIHHKTTTPTVAQLFGSTPGSFYKSTFVVAEMGFDGVDINMGCPDIHIAKKGGGAALINNPKLAKEIIKAVKQAINDWHDGKKIHKVGLKQNIVDYVKEFQNKFDLNETKKNIPVSVKTRIGYKEIITEKWIGELLEAQPDAIIVHGRTFIERYSGHSHWDEIEKAAKLIRNAKKIVIGNGDIKSINQAKEFSSKYFVNGVLIGRACLGNPWIFGDHKPTTEERFEVILEHVKAFMELTPDLNFLSLRKHMAWYCKDFPGANEMRVKMMQINSLNDVQTILNDYCKRCCGYFKYYL